MTQAEQIAFILANYETMPQKYIAREIGRSGTFVRNEMKRQGVWPSATAQQKFKQLSQFTKGSVPVNKGKKQHEYMTAEQIERTKASRFKKGSVPHNTRYNYALSLRYSKGNPYYWIRLSKSNWQLLHRYIWQQVYGPIPKSCNVQFKDGDSTNCATSNLYLINRKTQAAVNQKGGKKLPYELVKTIQSIQQLKSKIHEKQN